MVINIYDTSSLMSDKESSENKVCLVGSILLDDFASGGLSKILAVTSSYMHYS